jgi:hypothetical protein
LKFEKTCQNLETKKLERIGNFHFYIANSKRIDKKLETFTNLSKPHKIGKNWKMLGGECIFLGVEFLHLATKKWQCQSYQEYFWKNSYKSCQSFGGKKGLNFSYLHNKF